MARKKYGDFDVIHNPDQFEFPDGYKKGSGHGGHKASFSSIRTAIHHGRNIKIKTTYRIEIDDEPITMHTAVMNDGSVHYHGLPNYSFGSAIDLAKKIIDISRLAHVDRDELGHDHDRHHGTVDQESLKQAGGDR